jgi:hypothetical protein
METWRKGRLIRQGNRKAVETEEVGKHGDSVDRTVREQ